MTSSSDNRFFLPAWGISLALHSVVVGLALAFVSQVKPILSEEVFKWDIGLVQEARPETVSAQIQSSVMPERVPVRAMPQSSPRRTVTEVFQASRPLEQKAESIQPIEQKVEVPQVREEPVERSIAEIVQPTSEPVAMAASPEPVESHPVQQEPVAVAPAPPSSSEVPVAQEAFAPVSAQDGRVDAAPVQVTRAAGLSAEAKLDYQWLAESLWRRVAELKHYPNSARMNGQEGKVILKAVIRSDGYLADVSVQKSSGYSVLDAAAIESVKLACPLHMKRAIGKPQIVVSLPIVYSLAN